MKFKELTVKVNCNIRCESQIYSSHNSIMLDKQLIFKNGINILEGEIDSDVWAVSYLLSMYVHDSQSFLLSDEPKITLNGSLITLEELSQYSCYMDKKYPLFSTDDTVRTMVSRELEKSGKPYSIEQVRDMFYLDHQRFERPLRGVGNEIFRSMAAVGYAGGKELFCFPWLSRKRFDYYHRNITGLLEILNDLDKMTIVPRGFDMI